MNEETAEMIADSTLTKAAPPVSSSVIASRLPLMLYAIPWLVFGVQHFMYADFVAQIVPAYFPARVFWVYLTGAAMIAAGASLLLNRMAALAAFLLGLMVASFILLIHTRILRENPADAHAWTRAVQDAAIACAAFVAAGHLSDKTFLKRTGAICRYLFAAALIVFGVQQFQNLDFLTARVPDYLPFRLFWVDLTGIAMLAAAAGILLNKQTKLIVTGLGCLMLLLNLLHEGYLLATDFRNPQHWTALMLNLAITAGVLLAAEKNFLSNEKTQVNGALDR